MPALLSQLHLPYIVSNRDFIQPVTGDYPNIAPNGSLTYLTQAYDPKNPYKDLATFLAAVANDITVTGKQVMIFIHGYANPWPKVIDRSEAGLAGMISHFWNFPRTTATFDGPIILFDWPSVGKGDPLSCIPYRDAQQNALKTATQSFGNLDQIIQGIIAARPGTQMHVVCHSMGNLVFAKGAGVLKAGSISTALMVAAAIDGCSFSDDGTSPTKADGIQTCLTSPPVAPAKYGNLTGAGAFVFFSQHDNALPAGLICDSGKITKGPAGIWTTELGLSGPVPTPISPSNTSYYPCLRAAFNCSPAVNTANLGSAPMIHTSYYYNAGVLDFMNGIMSAPSPYVQTISSIPNATIAVTKNE
jgi:pimeloyl-ACP methyl ester carboxylesterase